MFRRMESYVKGGDEAPRRRPAARGRGARRKPDLRRAPFAAANHLGIPRNPDYNGEDQEGIVKTQTTIHNGCRMSTAHCYLEPARNRPNLRIATEAHTTKVLLEGTRCVGIEYEQGGLLHPGRRRARGDRAGAVATPQLLELSGIGRPELLSSLGIEVKYALSGVGENFRDHLNARIVWRVKVPAAPQHPRPRPRPAEGGADLRHLGRGFYSLPSAPLLAFLKTRRELETPDVQMHLVPYAVKNPKKAPAGGIAGHDDLRLSAPPREPRQHPHPLRQPARPARDPLQLPRRPDRPAHHGGRLPPGACHRPTRRRWSPSAARSIPPANRWRATTRSWTGSAATPRPPTTRSAPAAWATRRTAWWTTNCACTASPACASPTPPSSPPCRAATPARPASWSAKRADLIRGVALADAA